jgi:hypothetical protein
MAATPCIRPARQVLFSHILFPFLLCWDSCAYFYSVGLRSRTCTCDPGYSLDGFDYFNNAVVVPTIDDGAPCSCMNFIIYLLFILFQFSPSYSLPVVSMCAQFGCTNATCTPNGPNSRTCTCPSNYEVNASSHATSVSLDGPVAWGGCSPIDYCTLPGYGCGVNATCVNTGVGERACTCTAGYTSSSNFSRVGETFSLLNDDPAPGCPHRMWWFWFWFRFSFGFGFGSVLVSFWFWCWNWIWSRSWNWFHIW